MRVKEFLIYTGLRFAMLVGTFALVVGVWFLVADSVNLLFAAVIALVVSGLASYFLLEAQREAFARRIQSRARRAQEAYEQAKTKEDED